MTEPTDEQLYADWVAGDQHAGRRLISRRLDGTRRFVRSLLTGAEYEDAVQEVFERLARRARDGGEIRNVKAFTAGVAYNVVREQLRGKSKASRAPWARLAAGPAGCASGRRRSEPAPNYYSSTSTAFAPMPSTLTFEYQ